MILLLAIAYLAVSIPPMYLPLIWGIYTIAFNIQLIRVAKRYNKDPTLAFPGKGPYQIEEDFFNPEIFEYSVPLPEDFDWGIDISVKAWYWRFLKDTFIELGIFGILSMLPLLFFPRIILYIWGAFMIYGQIVVIKDSIKLSKNPWLRYL